MNHYGGKSAMPYVGAPKDFDRIAKEFHVDYAFHKVSPGHYLLFFLCLCPDLLREFPKLAEDGSLVLLFVQHLCAVLLEGADPEGTPERKKADEPLWRQKRYALCGSPKGF